MQWVLKHPRMTIDHLGLLPDMISEDDPRPAREQFNTNYAHGGGWHPFKGHTMKADGTITYPGDPPLRVLASTTLRNETIHFYEHDWVAIVQPDGSFEICRMD
jgi:hypothetical protein